MASEIDTCNRALSLIGTQSTISSFNDGTAEAVQCGLWFNNVRQGLLRAAPWGFARAQIALTQIGDLVPDQTSPYPWLYKYEYPPTALAVRYILSPPPVTASNGVPQTGDNIVGNYWLSPSRKNRFIPALDVDNLGNQRRVLLTNIQNAIAVYTYDVTNVDLMDPMFESALSAALAFKLVVPLSGNVGMQQAFMAHAEKSIINARVADGNEAISTTDHVPDWIATRGIVPNYLALGPGSDWGYWTEGYQNFNWGM